MEISENSLSNVFENYALKKISKMDVDKGAYLPNKDQREVLALAGYQPAPKNEVEIFVPLISLIDGSRYEASYYQTVRKGSGRKPETRMGKFTDFLEVDKTIAFCTDGKSVFISLVDLDAERSEEDESRVYKVLDPSYLKSKAQQAGGKPNKVIKEQVEFQRSTEVKSYVLRRADGRCEMPNCDYTPFLKDDKTPYLEVHHVTPLSEEGDDSIYNAVALCANCHRKCHYSSNRDFLKEKLQSFLEDNESR